MTAESLLREHQLPVDRDLEPPPGRRDQLDDLQPRLQRFQQLGRQTGGAFGVVSDDAVFDSDGWHRAAPADEYNA